MKKYITLLGALCLINFANGQSYEDALKFSQNIYEGTARFQGMGGAFSALGGDFTTLSINPAGAAIFRMSEFTITPTVAIAVTNTDYINTTQKERKGRFGLGNFGYIGAFESGDSEGLVNFNFGIGFNKLQNNTQRFSALGITSNTSFAQSIAEGMTGVDYRTIKSNGTSTEQLAWATYLVDTIPGKTNEYVAATENMAFDVMGPLKQSYYRDQSGYVGEYVFNCGINLSNKFFFGMTFGVQDINNDIYEEYIEKPVNAADFNETNFTSLRHDMERYTSGIGYNLKFGAIILPVAGLRVGAYIHTPTWMYLTEEWVERMYSSVYQSKYEDYIDGVYDYRINAPFKWGAGIAYTFGTFGLLSVDYEGVDYSDTRMYGRDDRSVFKGDNDYMNKNCRTTTNVRVGGEVKIQNFAVRGGYSFYQNPEKGLADTHMGSVGLGYRMQYFFADLAYSFIPSFKKDYIPYSGNPYYMSTDTFYSKVMVTFGFRF